MGFAARSIETDSSTALEQLQNTLFLLGHVNGDQIVSAVRDDLENEYTLNDLFLLRFIARNPLVHTSHLQTLAQLIKDALISCAIDKSELILNYARCLSIVGAEMRRI